jgi:hypothetical protein
MEMNGQLCGTRPMRVSLATPKRAMDGFGAPPAASYPPAASPYGAYGL